MKYNLIAILSFCYLLITSCANPSVLSGGAVDTSAPEIVHAKPKNASTNFTDQKIYIRFNEYIQLSNLTTNVFISPATSKKPKIKAVGKVLEIRFLDKLKPNTTYNIILKEVIKDYSEANTLKLLNYTFSTGDYLDSMSISGKVLNAFDNSSNEDASIYLYSSLEKNDTFYTPLPNYIAMVNTDGSYKIDYIKPGSYNILVFEDVNNNNIFDASQEPAALPERDISINQKNTLIKTMYVSKNQEDIRLKGCSKIANNGILMWFTSNVEKAYINNEQASHNDIAFFSENRDSLFYYTPKPLFYTNQFFISINNQPYTDTIQIKENEEVVSRKAKACYVNHKQILLVAKKPVKKVFDGRIRVIAKDSLLTFSAYDSSNNIFLNIQEAMDTVTIKVYPKALLYFDNTFNEDTLIIKTYKEMEHLANSNIIITCNILAKNNSVLHVLNEEKKVLRVQKIGGLEKIVVPNLKKGTYFIKIFKDENKNEQWDAGSFLENKPPEKNILFNGPVVLKENWDKEIKLNLLEY